MDFVHELQDVRSESLIFDDIIFDLFDLLYICNAFHKAHHLILFWIFDMTFRSF